MKKTLNPIEYPIVLKSVGRLMIISVPDLGIELIEPLNSKDFFSRENVSLLSLNILKAYKKIFEKVEKSKKLKNKSRSAIAPPSLIRNTLKKGSDKPLTTKDASKILKLSEATIKRMTIKGELKSIQTGGGHRRFEKDELYTWLRKQRED